MAQEEPDLDSGSDEDIPDNATDGAETEIGSAPTSPTRRQNFHARGLSVGSIAEDVIEKRVRFGRFAANWLSRKNLGLPRPGALEKDDISESPFDDSPRLSSEGSKSRGEVTGASLPQEVGGATGETQADRPSSDQAAELLPKLLRYTKLLFASRNFFFAYDYDLTRSYNAQEARKGQLPLHKIVDPLVCLNRNTPIPWLRTGC